jgi:hypothetical protein
VTIISVISCPITVTRLIAESPPTFTVWQPSDPPAGGTGVDDGAERGSSALPEPLKGAGVGVIGDVRVGVGKDIMVGAGVTVGVGAGVGDVMGTVVSGGAITVTYPERLRVLATLKF